MDKVRIIFFGSAELACASLQALADWGGCEVAAVVTQPDKPAGRDLKLHPSPVKTLGEKLGIPVLQPLKARSPEFLEQIRGCAPELMIVAAYGQILPQALLDIPRHGCLNVHTSLLPKYRGAAPIQWAILNGDSETGVTIMKMDAGLDTGDILTQEKTAIEESDNSQTLHDRLAQIGAKLLIATISDYLAGRIIPRPQPAIFTYARKITKADGALDWRESATTLWNKVRGLTPWPGAYSWLHSGSEQRLLKIWEAKPWPSPELRQPTSTPGAIIRADKTGILVACAQGDLLLTLLQKEGGKKVTAEQYLAGHRLSNADQFVSVPPVKTQ